MSRLTGGTDPREVPVGVLAYIGDAVFELYARMHAAGDFKTPSGAVHSKAVHIVRAGAQAKAARFLLDRLSEEEQSVFYRARNHTVTSSPRNADPAEYRLATGFEAVIGYLYLVDRDERLDELLALSIQATANTETADTQTGE